MVDFFGFIYLIVYLKYLGEFLFIVLFLGSMLFYRFFFKFEVYGEGIVIIKFISLL